MHAGQDYRYINNLRVEGKTRVFARGSLNPESAHSPVRSSASDPRLTRSDPSCYRRGMLRQKRSHSPRSEKLFAAASRILPGGVDSPVRAFKAVGETPRFIVAGRGAHIE